MSFSILILTYQEEINIGECLDALSWCDDVVVLDSFSSDRTADITREKKGVRLLQRKFDDFAGQRNYGMTEIKYKHPWVFHLDADERITPELRAECEQTVKEDRHSGYFVSSKLMFRERWLKHSGMFPIYQVRFVKTGEFTFKQHGHGQREDMATRGLAYMKNAYLHYNFSKGIEEWKSRHAKYARQEAAENLRLLESKDNEGAKLFSSDPIKRRRALKLLSTRMPLRGMLRFFYMYVIRLGVLDGSPGYEYCKMLADYERAIARNLKELKRQQKA